MLIRTEVGGWVRLHAAEFSIPGGVNRPNAGFQRRMSGQQAEEPAGQSIGKEQVAGIRGVRRFHLGAIAANFLQRAGKAGRIASELHRRGIGQKFALAADGGLDEASEKNSERPDGQQQQTRQHDAAASAPANLH